MAAGRLRRWAGALKRDTTALWFACWHPGTPRVVKILALLIVAYALSPIDLIPDFVPVLGYVDELILLPAAIYLAIKLMPADVLAQCRSQAQGHAEKLCRGCRNRAGLAGARVAGLAPRRACLA